MTTTEDTITLATPKGHTQLIDAEMTIELKKINWNDVTYRESQLFGLSIGLLNDAVISKNQSLSVLSNAKTTFISAIVILVIALIFKVSMFAMLMGLFGTIVVNVVYAWLIVRSSDLVNKAHRDNLLNDVKSLASSHPAIIEEASIA